MTALKGGAAASQVGGMDHGKLVGAGGERHSGQLLL